MRVLLIALLLTSCSTVHTQSGREVACAKPTKDYNWYEWALLPVGVAAAIPVSAAGMGGMFMSCDDAAKQP
jgi:hypothetical protein